MVVTQKNRSELERELEAAERELSQLQAQHKAQQIEGGVGAGDDEDEDDDDVDVGFNDEELEALLDRLADSGESDALTALLNDDATQQDQQQPPNSDKNRKALLRYRDEIGLNQAFTGIMFNPPQMLSQDGHINYIFISGSLPSFLNHTFGAEVKLDTITGEVADLKLKCAIPQLRGCIKYIQHKRSLPLFFQTVRKLGDILQYFNHVRQVVMLRYSKHVLSFDTTNICFVDHKKRRLIFTYNVKWQTDYSRLEPTFSLYGRLGDEQPSAEQRVMLQSLSDNFLRMIQLGVTVQKALEATLDVFLYAQRTPLSERQKRSIRSAADASYKDKVVEEKRRLMVLEKRKERREHMLLTLFESRNAATEAQKQAIVEELREKRVSRVREAKKKEKTDKRREEKIAEIKQRKKEQMRAEKRQQRRRDRERKREKGREENERVEGERQAREERRGARRENDRREREEELANERREKPKEESGANADRSSSQTNSQPENQSNQANRSSGAETNASSEEGQIGSQR